MEGGAASLRGWRLPINFVPAPPADEIVLLIAGGAAKRRDAAFTTC